MKFEEPPQPNSDNNREISPNTPEPVKNPEPTLVKKIGDFSSAVANERTLSYEQGITNPQELEEEKAYNDYVFRQLASLRKDSLSDSDVSDALADLSFRALHYRESLKESGREGQADDPDQKETFESLLRIQRTAKNLFMESAKKIYPDIKSFRVTRASFAEFQRKAELLNAAFPGFLVVAGISAIQKNNWAERENNPRLLLADLDDMIDRASTVAEEYSIQNFLDSDQIDKEKEVASRRGNLAELVSLIYEMELVRNQLQQKVYGGSEISPIDEGRVDALKADLDKPEPSEEKLPKITEMLQTVTDFEKQSEASSNSLFQRTIRPAIDAFREVYPNQEVLNQRLIALLKKLGEKIKTVNATDIIGKEKAESNTEQDYVVKFIADRMYAELSKEEQEALDKAGNAEITRQSKANKSGGSVKPPPEHLLSQLLSGLYTEINKK